MSAIIRKIVTVVEETQMEMGRQVSPPTRRAAAIAVIENPFAGKYVEDLSPLIAIGEELGDLLAKRAVAALGIDGAKAQSYGKAAAVGENGELEHAAAILHPKMGAPVRKVLSKGAALIPSSKKRSGPGTNDRTRYRHRFRLSADTQLPHDLLLGLRLISGTGDQVWWMMPRAA